MQLAPPAGRAELKALTSFRGFAALFVVIFHYSGDFLPNLDFAPHTAFVGKSYLWVDFFFLLSGFVISYAYGNQFAGGLRWQSIKQFAFARLARIYPLHAVVLLGFLILELLRLPLHAAGYVALRPFSFDMSPYLLMLNLGLLQTTALAGTLSWNGPAWSIGAEWISYLAFPLLALPLMRFGGPRCLLPVGLGLLGLAVISGGGQNLDLTYNLGTLRCLFEFLAGMALFRLYASLQLLPLRRDGLAALALAAVAVTLHLGIADILVPPLMALLILALARNEGAIGRALSWPPFLRLGQISYSLYLVHMLLLQATLTGSQVLLGRDIGQMLGPVASLAALLAFLAVLIPIAAVLHRRVELPFQQALRHSRFARTHIYGGAAAAPARG